jgi:hypothetical protein
MKLVFFHFSKIDFYWRPAHPPLLVFFFTNKPTHLDEQNSALISKNRLTRYPNIDRRSACISIYFIKQGNRQPKQILEIMKRY